MNNPGMDFDTWKRLREKWSDLDAQGHKIRIDFKVIADPSNKNNILVIDVIQHIDGVPVTETVQRSVGEAYAILGIEGLSMERLIQTYKEMMGELQRRANQGDADVVVTMTPTSPTSGEVRGYVLRTDAPTNSNVLVNYRHYYVLNALRDKMIEILGERWSQVKAVYRESALEFYFEYP
jgi:hypothetical protein